MRSPLAPASGAAAGETAAHRSIRIVDVCGETESRGSGDIHNPDRPWPVTTDEPRAGMLPLYRRMTRADASADVIDWEADIDTVMLAVYPFAALLADHLVRARRAPVCHFKRPRRAATALNRLIGTCGVEVIGLTSAGNKIRRGHIRDAGTGPDLRRDRPSSCVRTDGTGGRRRIHRYRHRRTSTAPRPVGNQHRRRRVLSRSVPSTTGPEPQATVFNSGDREPEVIRHRGDRVLAALYRQAREGLVTWASRWLQVTPVADWMQPSRCWRDIAAIALTRGKPR